MNWGKHMPATYLARHGAMRFLGEFTPEGESVYNRGWRVLLRTERGLEVGELLCEATPRAMQLITEPTTGHIVRRLTAADEVEAKRVVEAQTREFESCRAFIA